MYQQQNPSYAASPSTTYRLNVPTYQVAPQAAYVISQPPKSYRPAIGDARVVEDAYRRAMKSEAPACVSHEILRVDGTQGFLRELRPEQQFISCSEQITALVKDIFYRLFECSLPENVIIRVCSEEQMKSWYREFGIWNAGIRGFSINRSPWVSEIFVLQDQVDSLLLTIGHELGHVSTPPLDGAWDEEAKAFAFSMAWVQAIIEHDCLGLSASFQINPAWNGLHDVAWAWVRKGLHEGFSGRELFRALVNKEKKVREGHSLF